MGYQFSPMQFLYIFFHRILECIFIVTTMSRWKWEKKNWNRLSNLLTFRLLLRPIGQLAGILETALHRPRVINTFLSKKTIETTDRKMTNGVKKVGKTQGEKMARRHVALIRCLLCEDCVTTAMTKKFISFCFVLFQFITRNCPLFQNVTRFIMTLSIIAN